MRNLRKPYQIYVLNLDAGRIFWLTTILILLLTLSFFIGLLIGKEKAKGAVDEITNKNKIMMDEIINKLDDKNKNDEEYQFYELISPEKIIDREEKGNNISEYKYTPKQPQHAQKRSQDISLNNQSKELMSPPQNNTEQAPALDTDDKKLSSKNTYAVQVASYKKHQNAEALKNYLISK